MEKGQECIGFLARTTFDVSSTHHHYVTKENKPFTGWPGSIFEISIPMCKNLDEIGLSIFTIWMLVDPSEESWCNLVSYGL